MPGIHRISDSRFCGAITVAEGNHTVFSNGKLIAVEGDPNSHGEGRLVSTTGTSVFVNKKLVIVALGDTAQIDNATHPPGPTNPEQSSGDVFAYGG